MSAAIRQSITETFGFEAICINSALVSAQNRQRLYWVGKRNADGTYSKVDVQQPEDRGILLKDVLDGFAIKEKSPCIDANYYKGGNYTNVKKQSGQRMCCAEPVGTTKDGKAYCLSAGYSNGSGEKIGNYAAHTLKKGCKSMVAEPVNVTADGKAQCLRATCYKDTVRNIVGNDIDKKTGVAEPVCVASRGRCSDTDIRSGKTDAPTYQHYEARTDSKTNAITTVSKDNLIGEPVRVGIYPTSDGRLLDSQGMRIYSVDAKSVTQSAQGGGIGTKTGLYAIPVEFDGDIPIKAVSGADGKTYTVYEVKDGNITIKGKTYPIKLVDGYYIIRKLTVSECKRLQTVPEWYQFPVSDTQAYKMLGNGFTINVIAHLIEATIKNKEY